MTPNAAHAPLPDDDVAPDPAAPAAATRAPHLAAVPDLDDAFALPVAAPAFPDDPFALDGEQAVEAIDAIAPRPGATALHLVDPEDEPGVAPIPVQAPEAEPERRMLGELLVEQGACTAAAVRHAVSVQRRVGGRLGRLITHLGIAEPEAVATALAAQAGILREPAPLRCEPDALALIPEPICRRRVLVPLRIRDHVLQVATDDPLDPDVHRALRQFTDLEVEVLVATRAEVYDALREAHRDVQSNLAVYGLLNRRPVESAHEVLSRGQLGVLVACCIATLGAFAASPIGTILAFSLAAMAFYSAFAIFKVWSVIASLGYEHSLPVTAEEAAAIPDHELPVYTVLVPLYKEHQVLPQIVRGLAGLDYPTSRLDVKLLLEEDDAETVEVARSMGLPAFIDIVVTPDSQPKTKPKSCNYGLLYARGEFTVIFDAEDVPEKDQLRKAVAAFRKAPGDVVCLQGRLNYFNRSQNMLTKWFTGEYSGWFDMFVPGLDVLDMPIPLGGTSNHFVTDVLIELGAWDPFNVTEDADLGIRLAHAGYRTVALESTTYEEANSETFNWLRQRSRWVKGYIQTWLVHMRRPGHLLRGVGLRNFIGFQLVIGGTFFVFLVNPLQWAILLLWLLTQANLVRDLFPGALYYAAWTTFLLGNFAFVYINLLAVMRRRYWDLVGSALLSPIYWALMSIAAWRGLLQLITAPSYWEKTDHGLDGGSHADFVVPDADDGGAS